MAALLTTLRSSAAFAAATVPGLIGWWKADAITGLNDADSIVTWPDSSTSGATLAPGTAPVYKTAIVNSLPIVRFTQASSQYLVTTNATLVNAMVQDVNTMPCTIIAVAKPIDSAATQVLAGWGSTGSNTPRILFDLDSLETPIVNIVDDAGVSYSSAAGGLSAISTAAFSVLTYVLAADTTPAMFTNGTANSTARATPGAGGTATPTRFAIGAFPRAVPVSFWGGDVAELLVYNTTLSAANHLLVERYLGTKYAITVA